MRSKVLLGLLLTSSLAALASSSVGCSDGGSNTTGSGGAGGGGAVSSSSSNAVQSSSSTGTPPDTNTSCDTAEAIALDVVAVPGTLEPVFEDKDYYVFEGSKGLAILLSTDSKPDSDEFDQTYPDTVVTLKMKDANGNWVDVAQNDDPYPLPTSSNDASMYTVLPADGTYCIEVTECSTLFGEANCRAAGAPDILISDYTILGGVLITDESAMGIANETATEPADAAGTIDYENIQSGTLYRSLVWGSFADATDKDMWAFTVPADLKVDAGSRAGCHFEFYYPGIEGNGSSAEKNVTAYVVDAADPTMKIAEVDPNLYDTTFGRLEPMSISMPCDKGKDYLFVMERTTGAAAGANDFYFFNHYNLTANPVEVGPNDDIASPEGLKENANQSGGLSFFVDGDLDTATDVDYYSINVPDGATTLSIACEAQRGGSGVRGLTVQGLGPNDMPLAAGKGNATEAANKQLFAYDQPIPAGTTSLKIKISAASVDPNISSHFYRCGFHVNPPATP